MPRQNRVTPFGEIVATPERGTFMGNRGILHDETSTIRRKWQVKRWLICQLEFRGRQRAIMRPNRYTELFFLDEATALAAGHRPCFECQRTRYHEFRDAWVSGNFAHRESESTRAEEIDDRLHTERLGPSRAKQIFQANLDDLPDGVFVVQEGRENQALLVQGDSLLVWSPGGYRQPVRRRARQRVSVLTPLSTVAAIGAGFSPQIYI
jgi:hypothetical protein